MLRKEPVPTRILPLFFPEPSGGWRGACLFTDKNRMYVHWGGEVAGGGTVAAKDQPFLQWQKD